MIDLNFVCEVLSLGDGFNAYGDLWEQIWWRTDAPDHSPVHFMLNCNDIFYWGCADCEDLTPENLPLLKQAVADVRTALGVPVGDDRDWLRANMDRHSDWYKAGSLGAELFCARVRGMRPQKPVLKSLPDLVRPLFEACGPERTDA